MTRFLEQAIAVPAPARVGARGPAGGVRRPGGRGRPAGRAGRAGPAVPRAAAPPPLRPARAPAARSRAARAARDRVRDPGAVRHRPHARPARVDLRPRRTAAPGRGLRDPVDDPFGQGRRVGRRPRDPRGRRHDPLGHGDRRPRAARGGAPAALRRADPRARRAPRLLPAPLPPLEPRVRGPALVRAAHAVPARGGPDPVLARDDLRGRDRRAFGSADAERAANGVDALLAGLWSD